MALGVRRNKKCIISVFRVFLEICCSALAGLLRSADDLRNKISKCMQFVIELHLSL